MPSFSDFGALGEGMRGRWTRGDAGGGDDEPGFASLFAPVDPFNRWPLLVPLVSIAGAATVVLLTGVAAVSLVVMTISLLVVVYLLSEVFGYEIILPNMPRRQA